MERSTPPLHRHVVLIHGAWHGPWCWERLLPLLAGEGLQLHTPCLAGLGDRSAEPPDRITLGTHVDEIVALICGRALDDVLLVGHSYAGILAALVAARMPQQVASVLYLDAFYPQPGRSLLDLIDAQEAARIRSTAAAAGGRVPPFPPAAYGVTETEDARWLSSRLAPMPIGCFEEPVHYEPARLQAVRQAYVRATRSGLPDRFERFAQPFRAAGPDGYHEVASGHDMMITHPQETAAIVLAECRRGRGVRVE